MADFVRKFFVRTFANRVSGGASSHGPSLLLEDGAYFLMEDGGTLLLE